MLITGCVKQDIAALNNASLICRLAGTRIAMPEETYPGSHVVTTYLIVSEKITIRQNGNFESRYYVEKRILNSETIPCDSSEQILHGCLPVTVMISLKKEIKKSKQKEPTFEYDLLNSSKWNPAGVQAVIDYIDKTMKQELPKRSKIISAE